MRVSLEVSRPNVKEKSELVHPGAYEHLMMAINVVILEISWLRNTYHHYVSDKTWKALKIMMDTVSLKQLQQIELYGEV